MEQPAAAAAADAAAAAAVAGAPAAAPPPLDFLLGYGVMITSVLIIIVMLRGVLLDMVLGDLTIYTTSKPRLARSAEPVSRKQERRRQAALRAAQAALPQLMPGNLSPNLIANLEFSEEYEYLLMYLVALVVNAGASVGMVLLLGMAFPQTPITHVLGVGLVLLVHWMYKVEWAHQVISGTDKSYIALSAFVAASTAYVLLIWAPEGLLAFRPGPAALELTGRMYEYLAHRLRRTAVAGHLPQPASDANLIATALSFVAAALSGLLLAPGLRYGRLLQMLLAPPMWAHRIMDSSPLVRMAARLGFVAQLLVIPLWVVPMTEVLLIPSHALPWVRGGVMLGAALLQGVAVPSLVQTFLHNSVLQSRLIAHTAGIADGVKAEATKRTTSVVLSQAVKVAMQMSFAPVLLLSCGVMQLLASVERPPTSPAASSWDKQPSALFHCVAGFVGCWTCVAYAGWGSVGVLLTRLKAGSADA